MIVFGVKENGSCGLFSVLNRFPLRNVSRRRAEDDLKADGKGRAHRAPIKAVKQTHTTPARCLNNQVAPEYHIAQG